MLHHMILHNIQQLNHFTYCKSIIKFSPRTTSHSEYTGAPSISELLQISFHHPSLVLSHKVSQIHKFHQQFQPHISIGCSTPSALIIKSSVTLTKPQSSTPSISKVTVCYLEPNSSVSVSGSSQFSGPHEVGYN